MSQLNTTTLPNPTAQALPPLAVQILPKTEPTLTTSGFSKTMHKMINACSSAFAKTLPTITKHNPNISLVLGAVALTEIIFLRVLKFNQEKSMFAALSIGGIFLLALELHLFAIPLILTPNLHYLAFGMTALSTIYLMIESYFLLTNKPSSSDTASPGLEDSADNSSSTNQAKAPDATQILKTLDLPSELQSFKDLLQEKKITRVTFGNIYRAFLSLQHPEDSLTPSSKNGHLSSSQSFSSPSKRTPKALKDTLTDFADKKLNGMSFIKLIATLGDIYSWAQKNNLDVPTLTKALLNT